MFRKIIIELTAPICGCKVQNLQWTILRDAAPTRLGISCKTCKTELIVGHDMLGAVFALDKPYPGAGVEKPKEEPLPANVIPFKK